MTLIDLVVIHGLVDLDLLLQIAFDLCVAGELELDERLFGCTDADLEVDGSMPVVCFAVDVKRAIEQISPKKEGSWPGLPCVGRAGRTPRQRSLAQGRRPPLELLADLPGWRGGDRAHLHERHDADLDGV